MTTPEDTLQPLDHHRADHLAALATLFERYLVEEFDRTGQLALGFPAAGWLKTLLINVGGHMAGFISIDPQRCSIELIYLTPETRGGGLAAAIVRKLAAGCPRPLHLKGPLTPAGQHLADRLALPVDSNTPEEMARNEGAISGLNGAIRRACRHKRAGNPGTPCPRCVRRGLHRMAGEVVMSYAVMMRAADMLASPWAA